MSAALEMDRIVREGLLPYCARCEKPVERMSTEMRIPARDVDVTAMDPAATTMTFIVSCHGARARITVPMPAPGASVRFGRVFENRLALPAKEGT